MRISDIKGERVFDVMADIVDPIVEIAQDEEAARLFKPEKESVPDGMTGWEYFLQRLKESLPKILRSHRKDFIKILSTVYGITPQEYVNGVKNKDYDGSDGDVPEYVMPPLTIPKLLSDVVELVTDKEFRSFFG